MKAILNKTYSYFKTVTNTFNPSSSLQTYNVPTGVTKIKVDCVASKGADSTRSGANGGRVQCVLPVTGGSTLYVMVGSIPSDATTASYNASDIRTNNAGVTDSTSLNSRLVVAGGGGSGSTSSDSDYYAGAGGGLTGQNAGENVGGNGGSQTSGGSAYSGGNDGTFGLGGNGIAGTSVSSGAGGAGWYGGGGGYIFWQGTRVGSGGGGSSYTTGTCYNVVHTQGYRNGAGYITITADVPSTSSDYTFRTETIVAKAIKQDDKYYAVKSYEQGEYFGE